MSVRTLAAPVLVAILLTAANAPATAAVPDPAQGPYPYVIVSGQSIADLFLPLAKWRTRTGTRAIIRTIESIRADYPSGYDDAERVRHFLQDAHAAWGTRWVLIGGDTDVIPVREAIARDPIGERLVPTDLYYACLDGTWDADGDHVYGEVPGGGEPTNDDQVDLAPELFVGRAPVSTRDEARRFVDRTIAYQRTPIPDLATNVMAMAQMLSFGIDMGEIAELAMPHIVDDPAIHATRLYENTTNPSFPQPVYPETRASVRDSLSRGYGFVLGLGSGSSTLFTVTNEQVPFVDHYLTVDDVLGLTNAPRLGHVYLMTSGVNRVTEPTSLGEAFLKSPTGGAVTVIAPTDVEFLSPLSFIMREYVSLIFDAGVPTVGEAFVQQMDVLGTSSFDVPLRYGELLLGDPRLPVYTQAPVALTVEHAATLAPDAATIDVRVTRSGLPLAGAMVTACESDHPVSALSDAGGWVHLAIETPDAGDVALTVTARNSVPYEAEIPVQSTPVGVGGTVVARFDLDRPHPNPASATASLRLAIPDALAGERLEVVVYDPAGRRVRTIEAHATPGVRGLVWDLTDDRGAAVRNGVYLVSASAGTRRITRSVMVLR